MILNLNKFTKMKWDKKDFLKKKDQIFLINKKKNKN